MAIKDSNVTIMVKDMDASISFYESIGLAIKQRWANHYAQLTAPGITIGLHPLEDSNASNGSGSISIGFTTSNFEETTALLQKLNIKTRPRCFSYYPKRVSYRFYLRASPEHHRASQDNWRRNWDWKRVLSDMLRG